MTSPRVYRENGHALIVWLFDQRLDALAINRDAGRDDDGDCTGSSGRMDFP